MNQMVYVSIEAEKLPKSKRNRQKFTWEVIPGLGRNRISRFLLSRKINIQQSKDSVYLEYGVNFKSTGDF
jgi:hypothetical protein